MVSSILNGNPARIIKTYVQTPLIWGIHVAANSSIMTEADMPGHSYAISRFGSGSHLMAIVDADQRGWDTSRLEFVKVGNLEGARKSLAQGESDLFMWEKFMTKPFVDKGEFRRIAEIRTPWPCFMIAASEKVLKDHPLEVKKILAQINKSCELLMASDQAAQLIASRYKLQLVDVEKWLAQTQWNTNSNLPTLALTKVVEVLKSLQLVPPESKGVGKLIWLN
jgi:ABC-type nitrate/sulfonate/bicarbonate transport system substrate-binding protein